MNDNREQPRAENDRSARHSELDNSDALGRLLRDADPAAEVAPLSATELAAMRRAVLRAAGESTARRGAFAGPRWRLAPALVAAAAVTVVIAVAVWRAGPPRLPPTGPEAPGALATTPEAAPAAVPEPGTPATAPELSTPVMPEESVAAAQPADAVRPETTDNPVTIPDSAASVAAAEPAANTAPGAVADAPNATQNQVRNFQFTAPGGTRIIWTIDPNFKSPIAGQPIRQENGK